MSNEEYQASKPETESVLNKQMSPLMSAFVLSGIVLAVFYFSTFDIQRSLIVSAVAFCGAFWVVLMGRYMEKRGKSKGKNR